MKQTLIAVLILITIAAFSQVVQPPKKYKLEYTEQEWSSKLQSLQAALEIMRKSTLPSNTVAQWSDSVMVLMQDIQKQVGGQLAADTTSKKK